MNIKEVPIIIPVFNQLTYLRNFINWMRWYLPENPIYVVDNGSTYGPLLDYYDQINGYYRVFVDRLGKNEFIENMKWFLSKLIPECKYYVISDPDIMPHPSTPMNFLEVFKEMIELGYHRCGFGLITDDLPDYLNGKATIVHNEQSLLSEPVMYYKGHPGYRAPIDTTFCLYNRDNGGWSAPMDGKSWGNCMRLFKAFHLGWYLPPVDQLNEEMKYYFSTCRRHIPGEPSAGSNNNRPEGV